MEPSCGAPCGDIRIILIPEHPSKRFLPAPLPPPAIRRRHFLYPVPLEFHSYKLKEEEEEEGKKKPENSTIELTRHKKVEETKSRRGGRRAMHKWSKACNTPTRREERERENRRARKRFPSRPRSEPRSGPRSIWH
jgi:hypothetical protein